MVKANSFSLILIRHGRTAWNTERRYLGRTDLPLTEEGMRELKDKWQSPPQCRYLYASPARRCLQTAAIIFPDRELTVVNDLREIDFGYFEGKTAQEMSDDPIYSDWLSSGGLAPIADGEPLDFFIERCANSFRRVMTQLANKPPEREADPATDFLAAFVVHGGTIMALMSKFANPPRSYFSTRLDCGEALICHWDGLHLIDTGIK